jgi:hypothetical protein
VGKQFARSTAQQLAHWVRIGRSLEDSPLVSQRVVAQVLNGKIAYDDVDFKTQALVRAGWDEKLADRTSSLNLEQQFKDAGQDWIEADSQGNAVIRISN